MRIGLGMFMPPDCSQGTGLVVEDDVGGEDELVLVGAVVVSGQVEGAVKANLGADLDGGAEPVGPAEGVFVVARLEAGALALLVIEEIGAEREGVAWGELFVEVIDDGVCGGSAADLAGVAVGAVGHCDGLNRTAYGGDLALIHIPGLSSDVDGFGEATIPGDVVVLDVVVAVDAVVDAAGAGVDVVVDGFCCVTKACGAGGLGVSGPEGDVVAAGETELEEPLIGELEGGQDTGVGDRGGNVRERVAEHVVVGGDLDLDAGEGGEAAYADVGAVSDVREVEIEVVEGSFVAVLAVVNAGLMVQGSFFEVEAVVGAEDVGDVEAPVDVLALDGVREALGDEGDAVEDEVVGEDIVGDGRVRVGRGAEVE